MSVSIIKKRAAAFLSLILGVTLMAPITQAANPIINNVTYTPAPFYTQIPNQNNVFKIEYDYNTGGYPTGPVIEQIQNETGTVVAEFGANGADDKATGHYILNWDGKMKTGGAQDGTYVSDGKYKIYIYSETASPPAASYTSPLFTVAKAVPATLALTSPAPNVYYMGSGNLNFAYNLKVGSGSATAVRLKIKGPLNNPVEQIVATNSQNTDGNYSIAWNGQLNNNPAIAGDYTWTLFAISSINGYSVDGTSLTGNFVVSNQSAPSPTLSDLTVNPNPYDPSSGNVTFGYKLNGSAGYTHVNAAVYSSSDMNTAIKSWDFNNQASGNNSFTWDGKNASSQKVANGPYLFKVWGTDGNFSLLPMQTSFTVAQVAPTPPPTPTPPPPPSGKCAGFTDVSANDPNCDAIEYVKSIGAMTGNPDGTFDQDGKLQRDQIAKIVLETFDLYNSQTDYCKGQNPFPDVTTASWAFQYICRGVDLKMITGYLAGADAGFYRPGRFVNRIEFLALLLRNLNDAMPGNSSVSYLDVPMGEWFTGYAKYSKDHGLFTGSYLYPTNTTTREEVARIIFELHNQGKI